MRVQFEPIELHTPPPKETMLDSTCLVTDWVFTILVTVGGACVYIWPRRRLHPMASIFIAFAFLCYALQYFLLEFASVQLERTGRPDLITLLIPAMALVGVGLLFIVQRVAEIIFVTISVMIIAQTNWFEVTLPIGLGIAIIIWAILEYSAYSNIKHVFDIAIMTSAVLVFGMAAMILEVSVAINNLPYGCQEHFNMFLTCDQTCGSFIVYSGIPSRVLTVVFWGVLFLVRFLVICVCTRTLEQPPDLRPSFLCCGAVNRNNDAWMKPDDKNIPFSPFDGEENSKTSL